MTDSGNFRQTGTGSYTVTVHNAGPGATGNSPATPVPTVTVSLDANLTYAAGSGGSNWTCGAPSGQSLACTYAGVIAAANDFPALTINVNIGGTAPASVSSSATYSGGGDGTPANNTATRSSTVTPIAKLTVAKVHNGTSFTSTQNGSYTITVANTARWAMT